MPFPVVDNTTALLKVSLDGLSARARAHSDNIANVETGGYRARVVDFEASLAAAHAAGDPQSATISVGTRPDPTRLNGSNVDVATEMTGLDETQLRVQFTTQALNAKYALVRAAVRGSL